MATLSDVIKETRIKKGLRMIDVAVKAGCSQSYVSDLENRVIRVPSEDKLIPIAEALDLDINYVLGLLKQED